MTKKRWLLLGLALSVAFNCTFLGAFGYRLWSKHRNQAVWIERIERIGPGGSPMAEERFEFRMEQREHLKHIRERFLPRVGKIHERLFEKRRQLADMVTADKPDTIAIGRVLDEIGRLQIQIEKDVVRQMLKERDVMDPEQRERFLEMIERRFREGDQFMHLRRFHKGSKTENPNPKAPRQEDSP